MANVISGACFISISSEKLYTKNKSKHQKKYDEYGSSYNVIIIVATITICMQMCYSKKAKSKTKVEGVFPFTFFWLKIPGKDRHCPIPAAQHYWLLAEPTPDKSCHNLRGCSKPPEQKCKRIENVWVRTFSIGSSVHGKYAFKVSPLPAERCNLWWRAPKAPTERKTPSKL